MSHVNLAECIRLAANIREASYDHVASRECYKGVPPRDFYSKSLRQACEEAEASWATHKGWGEVTYMLLSQNWNEALDWANKVLSELAPPDMLSQSA